jgi:hypothetical protein
MNLSSSYALGFLALALASVPAAAQQDAKAVEIPLCNDYKIKNDAVLGSRQRACIWVGNLFSQGAVFGAAVSSAYGQWTDDEPSWGQGAGGYARRYSARYAQGVSKATAEYLVAWADREDPRSKPSGCLAFKRVLCVARSLVAQPLPNQAGFRPVFSKLAGAAANGFIGMTFYPDSGTVNESLRRSATSLGSSLLTVEIAEFEPEIFRWIGKRFSPKSTPHDARCSSQPKPQDCK